MKRILTIIICLCMGLTGLWAQNTQISGTITGADDGQPLPGVTVMVKGTTTGTVTDLNGRYTLQVPQGSVIVFSFVGMVKVERPADGTGDMDVALDPDVVGIDEVVVTAIGIKRAEKSIGYSATRVAGDELTATSDRSMLNSLQGKVAGVQISSASGSPGASTRVVMRGLTSLSGSNQPLYVIDGMPVQNAVINDRSLNGGLDFGNRANDINPEDIESVTVLKGSAGTALYGSRAANGAIVITTKKGSPAGFKVDAASSVTFSTPLRLPLMQNEYGQGWYNRNEASDLHENGSWGPKFDGKERLWGFVVDNQQQIKKYEALETNVRDFFDVGTEFNNSISFSNGNEKSSYYASYSNVSSNGIIPTDADSYKRNTFSLKGQSKFGPKFTSAASLNYIRKDVKFVPTGQDQSVLDGLWENARDISIVDGEDYHDKFYNVDNYYTVYAQNPYMLLNEHGNKYTENRVFGNFSLDYDILPWLRATYRIGGDISNTNIKEWRAIIDNKRVDYSDEPGRVRESAYFEDEINSDFLLNINRTLGKDFDFNVILGNNINQRDYRKQVSTVNSLDIPYFYQLSNSASTPVAEEETRQRRIVGLFGNIDVGWRNMVYLNLTARNDWSSTLPTSNRSFFYPGANLSFVFTELMPDHRVLSFGKVRLGVSQTGNDAEPYLLKNVFERSDFTDGFRNLIFPLAGSVNGFTFSNLMGNDQLKPELSTEIEAGFDVRFFTGRLGVDFSYYDKTTKDLIWNADIAGSSGFTRRTINMGKITNKGVELLVTVIPVRNRDWEWRLTWNFTRNRNELVELTSGMEQISLGGTDGIGFVARPGQPLGLFEGQVPELAPDGRIVVNDQGLPIPSKERGIYGDSQVDFITGLTSTLTWKGFTLLATLDMRKGGFMYSRTSELMYFTGNAPQTTYNDRQPFIVPNSVQFDPVGNTYFENTTPIAGFDHNLNEYYSQVQYGNLFGKKYLMDKSFVKLREVSLSYRLPAKMFENIFIKGMEVAVIGRNLLLWTPGSNTFTDPEQTTFGNDLEADFGDYGAVPTTRNFGFSLRMSF